MKKIYLIVADGYTNEFTDGTTEIVNDKIIYHACKTKEDAEKDVINWKKEQMIENEKAVLEDRMRVTYNYKVMEVKLF